jgi:tetratricopeptide (TPR) repeat protein
MNKTRITVICCLTALSFSLMPKAHAQGLFNIFHDADSDLTAAEGMAAKQYNEQLSKGYKGVPLEAEKPAKTAKPVAIQRQPVAAILRKTDPVRDAQLDPAQTSVDQKQHTDISSKIKHLSLLHLMPGSNAATDSPAAASNSDRSRIKYTASQISEESSDKTSRDGLNFKMVSSDGSKTISSQQQARPAASSYRTTAQSAHVNPVQDQMATHNDKRRLAMQTNLLPQLSDTPAPPPTSTAAYVKPTDSRQTTPLPQKTAPSRSAFSRAVAPQSEATESNVVPTNTRQLGSLQSAAAQAIHPLKKTKPAGTAQAAPTQADRVDSAGGIHAAPTGAPTAQASPAQTNRAHSSQPIPNPIQSVSNLLHNSRFLFKRSTTSAAKPAAAEPPVAPAEKKQPDSPHSATAPTVKPTTTLPVTAISAVPQPPPLSPEQAHIVNKHTKLGDDFFASKDYTNAMIEFSQVVKADPDNFKGHFMLGKVLLNMNDCAEALKEFSRAVEINPRESDAHLMKGEAYRLSRNYSDAAQEYKRAIKLDHKNAMAHAYLGECLRMKGWHRDALSEEHRAISLNPNLTASYLIEAETYLSLAETKEAFDAFAKAIEKNPKDPVARTRYARALGENKKLEESVVEFSRAIKLDRNFAEAHEGLAWDLANLNKLNEALAEARTAVSVAPSSAEAHSILAWVYEKKGDPQTAVTHYKLAIKLDPNNAALHKSLGNALGDCGDLSSAIAEMLTATKMNPGDDDARMQLNILMEKKRSSTLPTKTNESVP